MATLTAAPSISGIYSPDFQLPAPADPQEQAALFRRRVYQEPEWYLREILGLEPWAMEIDLIKSVRDNPKTLAVGCVSSGKTHASAALVLWFLVAFAPMARVFALAPSERQLKINLFGEIARMHQQARYPYGGDLQTLSLKMGANWFALGFSPKDKFGMFGIHGPFDLLIADDGQGLKPEIWPELENALAGGTTRMLVSCNPVVVSGEIFEALTHRRGEYNILTITADKDAKEGAGVYIAPNIKAGRVVVPGTITQELVDRWRDKFGWDSDFCRTKVRAMLPKQEPDTLIPLDWIEAAFHREVPQDGEYFLGVDVARFGDDDSVLMPFRGRQQLPFLKLHGNDTVQVAEKMAETRVTIPWKAAGVDVIGVGAGVFDICAHQDLPVISINVGEKASDENRFANLNAEISWMAREALDPRNPNALALNNSDKEQANELMGDLASYKWRTTTDGRIACEPKDAVKKRIGRSPDVGDAFKNAVFVIVAGRIEINTDQLSGRQNTGLEADMEQRSGMFDEGQESGWVDVA